MIFLIFSTKRELTNFPSADPPSLAITIPINGPTDAMPLSLIKSNLSEIIRSIASSTEELSAGVNPSNAAVLEIQAIFLSKVEKSSSRLKRYFEPIGTIPSLVRIPCSFEYTSNANNSQDTLDIGEPDFLEISVLELSNKIDAHGLAGRIGDDNSLSVNPEINMSSN